MTRIFVSYANEDVEFVEAVTAETKKCVPRNVQFIRASDPNSLAPGAKWRDWILTEMDRADAALFFVSPNSVSRPWPNFELGYVEKGKQAQIVCVAIKGFDVRSALGSPFAAHHILPVADDPTTAARQLVKFIGERVPLKRPKLGRNTVRIESRAYPMNVGWERYVFGGSPKAEMRETPFGVSFGRSDDIDGFRYPASDDTLYAPWQFLFIHANPALPVSVYFVVELSNGERIKLFANTKQQSVGYGTPRNEFQIPLPNADRPAGLLIDTQSFVQRIGQEIRAVKGLRVRGPTELSIVGMYATRVSVPAALRKGAMDIQMP